MPRYGTYKLVQRMPGGEGLVAFTRILHRTKPDLIMDEARAHGCRAGALVLALCPPCLLAHKFRRM